MNVALPRQAIGNPIRHPTGAKWLTKAIAVALSPEFEPPESMTRGSAPDGRTFDFFGGCGWATNADRARVSEDPYLSLLVCYAAANHARSFR